METRPTIAVFDFDGTLTRKDSFLLFARYVVGNWTYWMTMARHMTDIAAFYMHLISNEQLKERLLTALYAGMSYQQFAEKGKKFADVIERCSRKDVVEQLRHHVEVGNTVAIVTASIDEWVRPWAVTQGVQDIIATKIEVDGQGKLTGQLITRNCYGKEKVRRFLEMHPNRNEYCLVVYGDSSGDQYLMDLADERHWIRQ